MKKIYTVTFHHANNYGAVLQAYALQKYLLECNYDTEILNYDNKRISEANKIFVKINNSFIKTMLFSLKNMYFYRLMKQRNKNFDKARKQLKLTKLFSDEKKVYDFYEENSIFIVGSDQIWNPILTKGLDNIYTLNFDDKNIKRISYAASSGSLDNLKNYEQELVKRLRNFDYISVREKQLQLYLTDNLVNKVKLVLDPTLLVDKKDWISFAGKDRLIKEKYIFTYEVANPNELFYSTINKLAKKTGYKIIYFGKRDFKNKYNCLKQSWYTAGPIEWINLILNAEYVVTTSFHGTALSIALNKKPFVILSTSKDRITSLLNILNLDKTIVQSEDDFDRVYNQNIDWKEVNHLLLEKRKESSEWLLNAIECDKNEQK